MAPNTHQSESRAREKETEREGLTETVERKREVVEGKSSAIYIFIEPR